MVERKIYMDKIKKLQNQQIIKVVTGVRRCGKSTLLKQFQSYLLNMGIEAVQHSEDVEITLLKAPKDAGYYVFSGKEGLVITKEHNSFTPTEILKSFHADTYCFDSEPEKECFLQYISSPKVKEIYFTGMFTSDQGDLSIQYYYPDFLAKMTDGSYQLIEVKGDNMIDDPVVKAKQVAAEEMATALPDVCWQQIDERKCA